MNETAEKLPAAAMIISACDGNSRRVRLTARTATPDPSAINGASGPSTSPEPTVARPARITPESTFGPGGPPLIASPSAGM